MPTNLAPSLALTELINLQGIYPPRDGGGGGATEYLGEMRIFAGNFAPRAMASASGQTLAISQNTALFSLLGTNYGGDGRTTFQLPDLGGKIAVGDGYPAGISQHYVGQTDGSEFFNIYQNNLPPQSGGFSQPVDNLQPDLTLHYMIQVFGIYPSQSALGTTGSPTSSGATTGLLGTVALFAGNFSPGEFMDCAGQLLPISEYDALFNLIGTTYGGDGQTTFALPDLRGRTIVGVSNAHQLGQSFGAENDTIALANMPTNMGGSGQSLDNHTPSLALNYIIALNGIFPSRNAITNAEGDAPYMGEVLSFAGNFAPSGYALCQGQLMSIQQNQALFSLLGTTYGGDGRTTFALPDLRGKDVIGADNSHTLGNTYGQDSITLTSADFGPLTINGDSNGNTLYGGDSADAINGNDGNDTLHGNGGTDALTGGIGNDTLDGGTGADTLTGGAGNDTYLVDNSSDSIVESAGGGTDTVLANANYVLSDNVENLTLQGLTIYGTGNGSDNVITGNAADNVLAGLAGNDTLDGGTGGDKMYGGAGNDTYFIDNAADHAYEYTNSSVDDGGNDTVNSSISITLGTYLENLNLIGSAVTGNGNALDNNITGNALDNTLRGMAGTDTLNGGLGADRMYGGAGNDTYYVDDAGDRTYEDTVSGVDDGGVEMVISSISLTLAPFIENLTLTGSALTGTGNELDNILIGNGLDNTLKGLAGGDALYGGAGADRMYGGAGDDIYYVDNAGDRTYEYTTAGVDDGGLDTVISAVSLTLGVFLENLILTTDAINGVGNELNNVITGDGLDNTLRGMDGNDTLDGSLGADRMLGGAGDDTYIVDNTGDRIYEYTTAGVDDGGNDTVQASIDFTLGVYFENLVLTGSANLNGTGNSLANSLTGNDGNNVLDGGTGADTLTGGLGDDTYIVDNAGDVVVEQAGQGTDTVIASFSYVLGANVENLVLTGTLNRSGYGNSLDNVITGNTGDNSLKGYDGNDTLDGGLSNDTMTGGNGDDTYVLDNAGDVVVENANQGNDTVRAGFSYTLLANFENLTLLGTANLSGTGNSLDNIITGNSGANLLSGLGGNDSYYIDNAGDVVTELLNAGTDTVFSSLAAYTLGQNVENLTLLGSAALNGTGNSLANVLTGNSGDNVLDGGTGTDTLAGGQGNDTYVVDNAGDVVTENGDEGTDTVMAGISYVLGNNVENLVLTGSLNRSGYGNGVDNVITGNSGGNSLKGYAGNDTLDGGLGNDTLSGGVGADTFLFKAGSGADTIADFSGGQNDVINVNAYTHGTAHAEYIHQVGGDIVIDLGGGNTITVTAGYLPEVTAHIAW